MSLVILDNVTYDTDRLTDEARQHLVMVQGCDAEIQRLQILLAITQTARNAYMDALRGQREA